MIYFPIMIGNFILCDADSVLEFLCDGDGAVMIPEQELFLFLNTQPAS